MPWLHGQGYTAPLAVVFLEVVQAEYPLQVCRGPLGVNLRGGFELRIDGDLHKEAAGEVPGMAFLPPLIFLTRA
jgi:hypothetical protein